MPLAASPRQHPSLGFPEHGSISVGTVVDGYLVNGAKLPLVGAHHAFFAEHALRGTNYATDELADALQTAAGRVAAAFPGSTLQVGNVAKGGGGRLPWSISHRAGRDMDLGYYLVDEEGKQVLLPTMFSVAPPEGTLEFEGRRLTFDAGRNWTLVESLLGDESIRVDYIFVADFLVKRMFDYATAHGVSAERLADLKERVRQPRGTLPHDDHFHVRIGCAVADQLEGCRDIVRGREVVPRTRGDYRHREKEVLALALAPESAAATVADAVWLLGLLRSRSVPGVAYRLLAACDEPVCRRALEALLAVEARPDVEILLGFLGRTSHPGSARLAFRLLRGASPKSYRSAQRLLDDSRVLVESGDVFDDRLVVRLEACRLLGYLGDKRAGKAVAALLHDRDGEVREAALWSLRALAGAQVFDDDVVAAVPADVVKRWQRFLRGNRSRLETLRQTLAGRGYKVGPRIDRRDAGALLSAVLLEDYISMNAQRALNYLFKRHEPLRLQDKRDVRYVWKKIVRRSRR